MIKKASYFVFTLFISFSLSGCGDGSGTGGGGNIAQSFTISGTVSGLSGTLVLQNNGKDDLTLTGNGPFTFKTSIAQGTGFNVTVKTQPNGQTCTVSAGTGINVSAIVTNISVVCSANTFTIGGTITGLSGTLVLQNNGGDDLTLTTNAPFTFAIPIAQGSGYDITIKTQPAKETCTVSAGTGRNVNANVTNVSVTCSINTFTIGGTLSGLSGTLVLQNNGSDDLTLTNNNPFTFTTPIAQGAAYNVTVKTQPTGQECTLSLGTGTNVNANVTNVGVTCANTVSFYESQVQPIWNAKCTSCHTGNSPSGGQSLDPGVSHGNIVNVKSGGSPAMNRITPNDVANSYLLHKLKGTQVAAGGGGSRMPLSGGFLSASQIATIEEWVNAGALK